MAKGSSPKKSSKGKSSGGKRRAAKKRVTRKGPKKWRTYEEVATYLLNQFAKHFKLGRFEGKQVVAGASGTEWELDAKGCSHDGSHFINVECKRHTKTGISQAIVAGTAWAIVDTGAGGGILVSPCGLQEGAKKVADAAKIVEVVLDQNSTTTDYLMRFLGQVCVGMSDSASVQMTETLTVTETDRDGKIISTKRIA